MKDGHSQAGDLTEADERVGEGRRKSMATVQCALKVKFFVYAGVVWVCYGSQGKILLDIVWSRVMLWQRTNSLYYGIVWFHME